MSTASPDETRQTPRGRGWGWPVLAKKAHYFDGDIFSLCGRWMYAGVLEQNQGGSTPDDCVVCTRALAKKEA